MSEILTVFSQNILPILLVAGFGFALRRFIGLEKQPISRLTFYVFSPALIFSLLVNSTIPPAELGQLGLYAATFIAVMALAGFLFGRILRFSTKETIIVMLAAMFANAGNFGLALSDLRYGAPGLARAAPFYVVAGMITWTFGVIIVSLGSQPPLQAVKGLTRLPPLYAVIAALFVTIVGIQVPKPLVDGITIAGRGAVPVMLIVLGMQMADVRQLAQVKVAIPAVAIRLLVAPVVAILLLRLFGMSDLNYSVSLLQSSVPIAVSTIILATEYDILPEAMTTSVVLSSLLGPITLVALIQVFGL